MTSRLIIGVFTLLLTSNTTYAQGTLPTPSPTCETTTCKDMKKMRDHALAAAARARLDAQAARDEAKDAKNKVELEAAAAAAEAKGLATGKTSATSDKALDVRKDAMDKATQIARGYHILTETTTSGGTSVVTEKVRV